MAKMSSLGPGSRLGPYEILALIGAGGMGQVWKARDTRLNRLVAIKVAQERFSERFEREARAVAALNHPHIGALFDVGSDYLVLEYVEGRPLEGPLPLDQVLKYAAQICDALDAAHKQHIIHRDLKPDNILVTKSGVKLLDFGLATTSADPTGDEQTAVVTRPGLVMGTLQYMSPEQLDGRKADARSDIYSLGLVLYEMVTGKRASQQTSLEPLQPPALERVVKTCLAKDPEARWQTAREVMLGLEWSAVSGAVVTRVSPPRSPWLERALWIGMGIALATLAIVATMRRQSATPVDVTRFAVYPAESTNWSGAAYATIPVPQFALSPDGRALVFVASPTAAVPMLWMRPMDEVAARALPGTENALDPFWSPDGHWVGFFADGSLKKIPRGGGPVQVVVDGINDPRGGSWGPDDTVLFATGSSTIFRVSAGGGTISPVTKLDSSRQEGAHRWPYFLPDGRHFVYTVLSAVAEQRGVYAGALDGHTKKLLLRARSDTNAFYASPGYLLFVDGDTLLAQAFDAAGLELKGHPFTLAERVGRSTAYNSAVSVSSTGTLAYGGLLTKLGRLTWFDRAGKPAESVGPEGDYSDFRLSPDERRLAASRVDPKFGAPDIWITELTRGGEQRLTSEPVIEASATWSPDGAKILFRTFRRGVIDFDVKSAAGGGGEDPVMLSEVARSVGIESTTFMPTDWSPDGRRIIFLDVAAQASNFWVLPLSSDRKPEKYLSAPGAMHANFSREGNLVAYTSNESGRNEVYVQTFPLSDFKKQVSIGGGYEPRWARDGSELFYLSEDRKLMAVSVGVGPSFGTPRALFQTRVPVGANPLRTNFVPTRDGKRFLINTQVTEPTPNPITVVLNWIEALKR
jgi:Tol biopolymer transport system component